MTYDAATTEQVRALEQLDLNGLRQEWRRRYGEPPKLRSPDLLARILSWRIQADAFGGLDPETSKLLIRKSLPTAGPELAPGMRLEREWKGMRETVYVIEGGFRWRDQTYPSLSKVAVAITGTKWNGPAFFGLRRAA